METRGGHHTHGDFLKMWSHRGWRELEGSFRAEDVTFDILCESSVCHPPSRLGWPPVGEGETGSSEHCQCIRASSREVMLNTMCPGSL